MDVENVNILSNKTIITGEVFLVLFIILYSNLYCEIKIYLNSIVFFHKVVRILFQVSYSIT
jgi:hypothetical protein